MAGGGGTDRAVAWLFDQGDKLDAEVDKVMAEAERVPGGGSDRSAVRRRPPHCALHRCHTSATRPTIPLISYSAGVALAGAFGAQVR